MSIITTVEAVPSRLFAIYATLYAAENGEPRERIESWATPPSLSRRGGEEGGIASTTLFANSLNEARKLGLVEEVEDKLRLTSDARGVGRKGKGKDSETSFRQFLRRTLFDPARAEETQQAGFMIALAWFLSVNPLTPMSFSEDPSFAIKAQIGEHARKTECTTLLNYQSFLYWARYLGFVTIVGGRDDEDSKGRRVIPDPMRAIEGALPTIFADQDEMPIDQFVSRLAAIFPVFEEGSVRKEYDAMRLSAAPARHMSIATSIALQRLADRQKIVLPTSVADAPVRILDFGTRQDRVSHIVLRSAA
jgi:hypothetical protein